MTPPEPEAPEDVLYLLDWFDVLSISRRLGESGPLGLAPADVLAWSQLTGNSITPVEFSLLTAMDAAYLGAIHEHRKAETAKYQTDTPKTASPKKSPARKK